MLCPLPCPLLPCQSRRNTRFRSWLCHKHYLPGEKNPLIIVHLEPDCNVTHRFVAGAIKKWGRENT